MNRSLYSHYARARQDDIERMVANRRIADEWQPAPPDGFVDRMGKGLVQLGARLISDRSIADRIEGELLHRAA